MKKIILTIAMCGMMSGSVHGQPPKARDAFSAMPDSLLPLLTHNNRLDMIDFMDAKMKAEVTNLLEGRSEMLSLQDDSLSLRVSPSLLVTLSVVASDADPAGAVFRLSRIYQLSNGKEERVTVLYDSQWNQLPATPAVVSSLLEADKDLLKEQ